jgi:hypothetical protein
MKALLRALTVTSVLLVSGLAFAQGDSEGELTEERAPTKAGATRLKTIDFAEGDEITGSWQHGNGVVVVGETHADLHSLIRVRKNFLNAMMRSAESL